MSIRLLLVPVLLAALALPARAESLFPFPRESYRLPNGMEVVLIRAGHDGTMMDLLVADVGMRNEQKPLETEYTHLMEHLMFRGSKNFPSDEVRRIYTRSGLYEQGFTTPDFTCYVRIFPSTALAELSRVQADKLQNLDIPPDEYRAETGAVLGEYLGYYREPWAMMDAKLREVAFTVHPYRDTPDHLDALKKMPENQDRVMKFYRDFYVPGNLRLVLVGDFDFASARRAVEETYGRLVPGTATLPRFVEPPQTAMREAVVQYPEKTAKQVMIGYRIPAFGQDLRTSAALELIQRIWFVEGGPLERKFMDEAGTVVEIGLPEYYFGRDDSLFTTRLKLKDGVDPAAVRESFFRYVEGIAGGVDPALVEKARRDFRYRVLGSLDSLNDLAFVYMEPYFLDPRPDAVDRYHGVLMGLTPEDLQRAARTILTRDRATVITLVGKES